MVEAQLVACRIFTASYRCEPRPSGNLKTVSFRSGDDAVVVTVGDVPEWVIKADLSSPYIVTNVPKRSTVLIAASSTPNPAWVERDQVYTTLQVIRNIDIQISDSRIDDKMGWYDLEEGARQARKFEDEVRASFDSITALLVHYLGSDVVYNSIYESHVATILRSGKPAQWVPHWREGPIEDAKVQQVRVLADLKFESLDRLAGLNSVNVEAIGRWYWRSKYDRDPFRAFLWTFAGLEVLAKSIASTSKNDIEKQLRFGLVKPEGGAAVRELLWPTAFRDDNDELRDPERNLVFKFALTALLLDPSAADADVKVFKQLQRYRNRIHGQHVDIVQAVDLSAKARTLLGKYTPLALDRLISR